ncbi:hypothetical protein MGALJ_17620 [Mycobacterium gallinarum]|uniref:Uncharacterized protein n=1 Tax=Mycobacterium gallinarum TaxID=39689 RepID=A0A9W4FES5_9MYCO|nr:hypothetical protein MGALJ_17620 [Mycobacterium gallinarum]
MPTPPASQIDGQYRQQGPYDWKHRPPVVEWTGAEQREGPRHKKAESASFPSQLGALRLKAGFFRSGRHG